MNFTNERFIEEGHKELDYFRNHNYVFTQNWFNVATKYFISESLNVDVSEPLDFLEIGVFEGRSATWFVDNYLHHPDSTITLIDPFSTSDITSPVLDSTETICMTNINNSLYPDKIIFHKKRSVEILPSLLAYQKQYDVIYVDGSHLLKDVLEDIILSWYLLKKGGYMILDDFWSSGTTSIRDAFNFYFKDRENEFKLIFENYQRIVMKL